MKSLYEHLYESILNTDDQKLDAASQDIKDSELKAMWDKYGLEVVKGPKGLTVANPVLLSMNDRGEAIIHTHRVTRTLDDLSHDEPSVATMFPDGVVLNKVLADHYTFRYAPYGKVSDLPRNVVIEELNVLTHKTLETIDRKINRVVYNVEWDSVNDVHKSMIRMDWTKYVHTLVALNMENSKYYVEFWDLMDMKNCPIKNVIILSGGMMFGLYVPQISTELIGEIEPDDIDDPKQKEAYDNFVENTKTWIKNNPKPNLFMNWQMQGAAPIPKWYIIDDFWTKQIIEQVTLKGDDLKFKTLSTSQKKNL